MATTSLSRTPGSAGNLRTFTISAWTKRSTITNANNQIISSGTYSSTQLFQVFFESDDTLYVSDYTSGGSKSFQLTTNRLFRDTSAYYHICVAIDTPQATPADRVKLYVNGVQETSFSEATYPSQDFDCAFNLNQVHTIGNRNGASFYFKGNMSNIAAVDGTALAPTSFGEVDSTSGIWKFSSPSGITWGTNGFWLKGTNSAALGTDSSGNTNTFAVASGTPTQSIDTPSNIYCTGNAIGTARLGGGSLRPTSFSYGNNRLDLGSGGYTVRAVGTLAVGSGKYYWEIKMISDCDSAGEPSVGIIGTGGNQNNYTGYSGNPSMLYQYSGQKGFNNIGDTTYGNSYDDGDIIGVALDLDNNAIYMSKNGAWETSGDPTSGASATGAMYSGTGTTDGFDPATDFWTPFFIGGSSSDPVMDVNFGSGYFGTTAISSAGTSSTGDDSVWEYDCPTGYYGISTKNINTYG